MSVLYEFNIMEDGTIEGRFDVPFEVIEEAYLNIHKRLNNCPVAPSARIVVSGNKMKVQSLVCELPVFGIGCMSGPHTCNKCSSGKLESYNEREQREYEERAKIENELI